MSLKKLDVRDGLDWDTSGDEKLILEKEMAYTVSR